MITAIDKNTALVLIDLQKGMKKIKAAHPVKDVFTKSAFLIDAFRNAGLPVVVVTVNFPGSSPVKLRKEKHGMPQGAIMQGILKFVMSVGGLLKLADEIKTEPTDIFITKYTWNAFYDTSLHNELQKRNITGVVIAGVATSIGVEGTARAASERGYNISFATDAMTDSNMDAHQNSIHNIFPRLGESGTTSEIIDKLKNRV